MICQGLLCVAVIVATTNYSHPPKLPIWNVHTLVAVGTRDADPNGGDLTISCTTYLKGQVFPVFMETLHPDDMATLPNGLTIQGPLMCVSDKPGAKAYFSK